MKTCATCKWWGIYGLCERSFNEGGKFTAGDYPCNQWEKREK